MVKRKHSAQRKTLYGTLKCVFQTVNSLVSWFAQELSGSAAESEGIWTAGCWAMQCHSAVLGEPWSSCRWLYALLLRISNHWSLQGQDHNLIGIYKVHPSLIPSILFLLLGSFPYISGLLTFSFKTKFKPIFCHECFLFIPTPSLSLSYMILNDTKLICKFYFYFKVYICWPLFLTNSILLV